MRKRALLGGVLHGKSGSSGERKEKQSSRWLAQFGSDMHTKQEDSASCLKRIIVIMLTSSGLVELNRNCNAVSALIFTTKVDSNLQ